MQKKLNIAICWYINCNIPNLLSHSNVSLFNNSYFDGGRPDIHDILIDYNTQMNKRSLS